MKGYLLAIVRFNVKFLERNFERVMRLWPEAREQMDPETRADYERRIRRMRERIKRLRAKCV